ncbi:hypothetical protein WME98_14440 [Sorangium sp. So ce296]|uniref:hypothetical protein n=1 Tax=Sorangium sp. So ce296 TaxID=3133296 RepID=UPI003F5DAD9E
MSVELIQPIVRQTTVLIAQLATSGGWRAPLAQLADQVFQDLATELERQGVSRKVSADMFGMGLRSYQRRVRRITESSVERGRSLWEAVLDYIRRRGITPRAEILRVFAAEDDVLLRGVLFDLCESRLIFQAGQGAQVVYRAVSDEELGALRALRSGEGVDELAWAIIYREGPLTRDELLQRTHIERAELDAVLGRLVESAQQAPNGANITFLGAVGTFERWAELNQCTGSPSAADESGCSTYSSCAGGVEVTLCTEQGGGAAWGSAEIGWATLKRHSLP